LRGRSVKSGRYHARGTDGGRKERVHRLVAEGVLGKPLPKGVEVHHVNENKSDNRHSNLVICENHAYHALLHLRARALDMCGNAAYRPCRGCRQYDDPASMIELCAQHWHAGCRADFLRRQREGRRRESVA
jgi:hypothetical protein